MVKLENPAEPISTDDGKPKEIADYERATRAIRHFNRVRPNLEAFARIFTGNPKMRILPTGGASATDGERIWMKVNIELGDEYRHDVDLCDKRDAQGQLVCPACLTRENMLVPLFHEIAHIAYDSFEKMSDWEKEQAVKAAVDEAERFGIGPRRLEKIRQAMTARPPGSYVEAAMRVSPFLHPILNALEDARVNALTMRSRAGMKVMFAARSVRIFEQGIENPDGSVTLWREQPENAQVIVGLFALASGYNFAGWFSEPVEKVLADPAINGYVQEAMQSGSAGAIYKLGFPILERLRELGYCKVDGEPQEDEPEPQPQPEGESDDEPDDETPGEEGEPDHEDTGGDSDDEGPTTDDDAIENDDAPDTDDVESDTDPDGDPNEGDDGDEAESDDEAGTGADDDGEGDTDEQESTDGDPTGEPSDEDGDEEDADGDGDGGDEADDESDDDADGEGTGDESDDEADADGQGQGTDPDPDGADGGDDDPDTDGQDDSYGPDADPATDDADGGESDGTGDHDASADDSPGQGSEGDESDESGPNDDPWRFDDDYEAGAPGGPGASVDGDEDDEQEDKGSPEDVARVLAIFGDHDDDHEHSDESHENPEEDEVINRALAQERDFDEPSNNVYEVKVLEEGPAIKPEAVARRPDKFAIEPTSELVMQRSLSKMRQAFSENKKGAEERNRRSGRINGKALGRRVPVGDDRLFQRRLRPGKRDYFVVIGLDVSYSTMQDSRIKMIKSAAMAQAELLDRIGVPFEIWAHTCTTNGQENPGSRWGVWLEAQVYVIKRANERWNTATRARLESLVPASANLDGHTMEFYRKRLDQSRATDRILMYYTDGDMPYENYEEELVILKRELRTCGQRGYEVVGVGVETDSPTQHGLPTVRLDTMDDVHRVVEELHKRLA